MDSRVTRLFMVLDFLETCVDEKATVTIEHLYQDHPTRQWLPETNPSLNMNPYRNEMVHAREFIRIKLCRDVAKFMSIHSEKSVSIDNIY